MLGAGGGGDVAGALTIARLCENLGTPALLGGVAWERLPIDPKPGPRPPAEIVGGRPMGAHAVAAGPDTATPEGVRFSESLMAKHLGTETVLIDVAGGARGAAEGIAAACAEFACDLVICADVGGDMLAAGDEPGLASPLCDAIMAAGACSAGVAVLLAVIGAGCDGELTPAEVLERVAVAAAAGTWAGTWSPAKAIVDELEVAAAASYTEASMQVVRCARGEIGEVPIRDGRRSVEVGPVGALCFFFDAEPGLGEIAPLAPLVAASSSVDEARALLAERNVYSELDWERDRAAQTRE